jgi:predicted dinucleotide-binding enzyme
MTVGVIGAGRMGRAFSGALARAGAEVLLGARGAAVQDPLVPECAWAPPDAVWRDADLVVLAVPFPTALRLLADGAGAVGRARTLVDVTNPGFYPDAVPAAGLSGGELVARAAPSWRVAKAFNTVPAGVLAASRMHDRPVSVPVAGGRSAKVEVFTLAQRLGFEPFDAGGLAACGDLEALAVLLARISTAHGFGGRIGVHFGQPDPLAATVPPAARAGRQ